MIGDLYSSIKLEEDQSFSCKTNQTNLLIIVTFCIMLSLASQETGTERVWLVGLYHAIDRCSKAGL